MALEGEGFFEIDTPQGLRYTRNGFFRLDTAGNIITQDGNYVLDEAKQKIAIEPNSGQISIAQDGIITVGEGLANLVVATIRVIKFEDPQVLAKEGNGLYKVMDNEAKPQATSETQIRQGFLERSNVNSIEEMTNMITAIRAFEAYQKVVQSLDETDDHAVNSIGRVV